MSDYTPFSINAPSDPRLPNGGGYPIGGLYDLVPERVGQVDELAQNHRNFGETTENWQGVDIGVTARLRNGLTVQGGTSTGRRLADGCNVRANLPEYGQGNVSVTASLNALGAQGSLGPVNPYCRIVEPYRTDFRGLATYTIPRVDVQVSGVWRSTPGNSLSATFVANNAWIASGPQPLGRNLSSTNSVTVNLIEPMTVFAERENNLDFRMAKILRFGATRTQVGVDVYNLMNADTVTGFNQRFIAGGAWLTPTSIAPARYMRVSAQIDF
jgi:hypothetical protein